MSTLKKYRRLPWPGVRVHVKSILEEQDVPVFIAHHISRLANVELAS
uniref:Uncharacterized protein n=1 Tax=Anguilla anguilla TaxID=7936 RepID=A0A0E9Q114_ANGAN